MNYLSGERGDSRIKRSDAAPDRLGPRNRTATLSLPPVRATIRSPALTPPPRRAMLSRVRTAALWGLEAFPVHCEVDVGPGLPGFTLVGLPDPSVREVRERVWPALRNAGFQRPERRVTVNLAPAGRRKEGAGVDLAVAIGLLAATEQVPLDRLAGTAAIGELSLDGTLRPVRGTLSLAEAAWREGATRLLCAAPGAPEAALVVTRLHSAAGLRRPGRGLMTQRPFRAPHHSLSRAALIGGGTPPRPGELSLAHHGVLFLDEFAEYSHYLLDSLRGPLETGT